MFRQMRRKNQQLSQEEAIAVLNRATSGVLALSGDDGYPYALPISYVYHGGRIYVHCAKTGHKIDAIRSSDKVSFCVIDRDEVVPEKYTTYFRSVIAFGRARIIDDDAEKRRAIELIAARYAPDHEAGRLAEIEREWHLVCLVAIDIEHMTGKEAIELVRAKGDAQVM